MSALKQWPEQEFSVPNCLQLLVHLTLEIGWLQ